MKDRREDKKVLQRLQKNLFYYLYGALIVKNMSMLFNFQAFIDEMREKDDKKEIVEKYEKHFWPIKWDTKDQEWYTDYLINFKNHTFKTPEELDKEFDWKLLLQLVAGSFSSDCVFEKDKDVKEGENPRELTISVKSGDQSVVKKVSELWSFQIMRLYEIYIEEQMNLHILIKEEEKDAEAILWQRQLRLERWKLMLDTLDKDELTKEAKKEQEDKMDDLMGKL